MKLEEQLKTLILTTLKENRKINSYLPVYAFTNENIAGVLEQIKIKPDNQVLTICSSGDHLFNLALNGALNVHLVDTNPLAFYYALGLKKAMFKVANYEEYFELIYYLFKDSNYDLQKEWKIWDLLIRNMDQEFQAFFRNISDYYFRMQEVYKRKISLIRIITQDYYYKLEEIREYNKYLQSEVYYNRVVNYIDDMHILFKNRDIYQAYEDSYDLIICSNALEYHPVRDRDGLMKLYRPLRKALKPKGLILATYIYQFWDKKKDAYDMHPIGGTDLTDRELLREELIWVDNTKQGKDAVLVLRK